MATAVAPSIACAIGVPGWLLAEPRRCQSQWSKLAVRSRVFRLLGATELWNSESGYLLVAESAAAKCPLLSAVGGLPARFGMAAIQNQENRAE